MSLLISDRLRSPLAVQFEEGEIKISCSTSHRQATTTSCPAPWGEAMEYGLHNKYLLDALKAAACDEVRIELSAPSPHRGSAAQGETSCSLCFP